MTTPNTSWKKPRPQGNRDDRRPDQRPQRSNSFGSLSSLRELSERQPVRKPQVQPEPLKFEGPLNHWYETERNGRKSKVFLVEVKKDVVTYKDKVEDKHSQTMSLAKFMKFYKPE
ncbi:hypothetical protein PA10_00208 [Pseudomonas phage pPa_SNUABM_DT01]|nr:hypothetical protein PA10_00208 [Pseudomonas phage pPa_SNUABM_DT01]